MGKLPETDTVWCRGRKETRERERKKQKTKNKNKNARRKIGGHNEIKDGMELLAEPAGELISWLPLPALTGQ